VGDDLREGKPTALVARAIAASTQAQAAVLSRIGRPSLSDADIAAVQEVLVDTGAASAVEAEITRLRDEAVAAIDVSGLTGDATRALTELAHFVTDRTH
jgi:geranylgeranyl diphosphate synthase type I